MSEPVRDDLPMETLTPTQEPDTDQAPPRKTNLAVAVEMMTAKMGDWSQLQIVAQSEVMNLLLDVQTLLRTPMGPAA